MAIGTTAAIIGSAVVGAGASALSSRNNSRAIDNATQAQTEGNAQSVALQRDIYGQNRDTLNPYIQRGNVAGNTMNALLGLGGTAQTGTQPSAPAISQGGGPGAANYYGFGDGSMFTMGGEPMSRSAFNDAFPGGGMPSYPMGQMNGFGGGTFNGSQQVTPAVTGQTPQQAANDAFDIFRGSTGYQFRVNEGMNALNSGYAGSGLLQSGAALKALDDYRQNTASAEFGNYMGMLGNQQGTGLSAAGAQAGVGVQYANNVSNLNSQNANALANAAVARANNSNALIGGVAGGIGSILGGRG